MFSLHVMCPDSPPRQLRDNIDNSFRHQILLFKKYRLIVLHPEFYKYM